MNRSTPGLPVHHQLPEFTKTHVHRGGDAIQPSHPLSSPSPPAPNPSQHQGLSNESTLHMRWPKYLSFSFSISPSKEIPHLRWMPVSPGAYGMQPRDPCRPWRGTLALMNRGLFSIKLSSCLLIHGKVLVSLLVCLVPSNLIDHFWDNLNLPLGFLGIV